MSPPAGRARRWCRCFTSALARDLAQPHPIAVLNLGGVANVTFVDGGDPVACDTGPGNALIDDFMRARTGAPLRQLRRRRGDRQAGPQIHRRRSRQSVFRFETAEIARPQCVRLRQYRPARIFSARWRRDFVGADRRSGRPHPAASAGAAAGLDRRRRRRAQPHADENAGRAPRAGNRARPRTRPAGRPMRSRRRPSPISPCVRSTICRSHSQRRPVSVRRSPAG